VRDNEAVHTRLFRADEERRSAIVRGLRDRLKGDCDVAFAYLFGSFARNDPFHDIDVAVYLSSSVDDRAAKALDLADTLSRRAGFPVDVRALNDAPLPFRFRAVQGTLLVSVSEEQAADFRDRTARLYADMAPRLRQAARDAFAR
jgi:predicted nucleotidyltransferase